MLIGLGFGVWGKTSTEAKCPSPCSILGVILTWVIPGAVNFGHLAKVVSARFLPCKGIIFFFIISKLVIKLSPHSKGWEVNHTCWRGRYLHLEFLQSWISLNSALNFESVFLLIVENMRICEDKTVLIMANYCMSLQPAIVRRLTWTQTTFSVFPDRDWRKLKS